MSERFLVTGAHGCIGAWAVADDTGGPVHEVREVVAVIEATAPGARITFEDAPFAVTPESFDGSALEAALGGIEWRSLDQGVRETIDRFRELERG